MEIIERPAYLSRIISHLGKGMIIILVGQRRVGKSYMLKPWPEETVAREFGNLRAIRDNYPKYVVSMDPVSGGLPEYPGIIHIHLREFLMTDF